MMINRIKLRLFKIYPNNISIDEKHDYLNMGSYFVILLSLINILYNKNLI